MRNHTEICMVDTIAVESEGDFIDVLSNEEECNLNEGQLSELWEVWNDYRSEKRAAAKLIMVPEWFSENEFNAGRRPFVFADVEHDDDSSGAVLWSSADLVDINVVENKVFSDLPIDQGDLSIEESIAQLDISDDDDYIDEPGKIWIPRSLSTVVERTGK